MEAKQHIRDKIPQSGLMDTANKEALEAVLLIEKIVETIGWKLDYSALELSNRKKQMKNLSKYWEIWDRFKQYSKLLTL